MNSVYFLLFGLAWFVFAYNWWGSVIKKKLTHTDDSIPTPSQRLNDGKDYVPTKPSILFGHHFSSIAGAGPIVGPIIAFALFGWLPAMIWVAVGSVFMGAVHDYTALMVSVRNDGVSVVEVAEKAVSPRTRNIFSVFVWLSLALVQAVFTDLTVQTFIEGPGIVIPTFGLIGIAIIFGLMVNRFKVNNVVATIICLVGIFFLIYYGTQIPVVIDSPHAKLIWTITILVYAYIASVLPVWILLQPRDYLSMYILIAGMVLGFTGMMFLHPEIKAPAYVSFDSIMGPMFPILFITIACGAFSGFHSLVASGTSAKQLRKESDGQKVAFGGMLTEGFMAILVIVMVASIFNWDSNAGGLINFQELYKKGPTIVFGNAFGYAVETLGIPLSQGISFGILMLNAFILTTLDTSTRLNRYIVHETLGVRVGGIFKNKHFATAASVIAAFLLIETGGYSALWHTFGAANQLIGSLALFVITAYYLERKSPALFTYIPAILMLVIVEVALIYNLTNVYIPGSKWLLASISVVLFVLGIIVAWDSTKKILELKKKNKQQ